MLSRFGLKEEPFKDNLDERFYFSTKQHERAYASMVYCITENEPAGIILGTSGVGKSLISQRLLSTLDKDKTYIPIIVLIYPKMSKIALLREIYSQLGLPKLKSNPNTSDLLEPIHSHIIDQYKNGKRIALMMDESHFLNVSALHLIRTLTNIETAKEKLITSIFIAEQKFLKRLQYKTYDSLRGRIKIKAQLDPLDADETAQFIQYRLHVAGAKEDLFPEESYELIYKRSKGICRNINKIAGQALFDAFFDGQTEVTMESLKGSLKNLSGIL
ncbi:MAG: AAA family ATPase [Planctomycetota bacterium]|jgi:general secretion pathway protein A|nr:AAA family ATPase [Planctomycetota bacterium]|tara:strand:+ start:137 stop:955 length:819 start_codon:yes stop_codon:yes gene_type:complete